jgi:hypothetical protein
MKDTYLNIAVQDRLRMERIVLDRDRSPKPALQPSRCARYASCPAADPAETSQTSKQENYSGSERNGKAEIQ